MNPELQSTDRLLVLTPPIKRAYNVVSAVVEKGVFRSTKPVLASLCPGLSGDQYKAMVTEVNKFYAKFLPREQFQYSFVYSKVLLVQNILENEWGVQLKNRSDQLKSGLSQLTSAQKEVDQLSKEAQQRHAVIQRAQKEANDALVQITAKMEMVSQNKVKASAMQAELTEKEVVIKEQRDKAEKELGEVKPLIEEARAAVSSIPNDAISEIKSFQSPPQAVAIVLEAVVRFMGMQDTSWKGMKSFLAQSGVMRQIAALDMANINPKTLAVVKKHVEQNPNAFNQAMISRVSKAAAPLAKWVVAVLRYSEIYVKIEPLMKAAEEANKRLTDLRQQLKTTQEQVVTLEREATGLKASYDQKTQDLVRFKEELKVIEEKKAKGTKMLDGLSNEKVRWTKNDSELSEQLKALSVYALKTAVMFVVAGGRTDDIRSEYCDVRDKV